MPVSSFSKTISFIIFTFVFFVTIPTQTLAQTNNPALSCKVHPFLVDDLYKLPFRYNSPEIVNGSTINTGDSIVYTFEITNKTSQGRVSLKKVTATQIMGQNEPIDIVQTNPINGTCITNNTNKSIVCNTNYSFADSAHYPIEYLFKINGNPNNYPKTSTMFNIETDAGTTQCASMLMIRNNEKINKIDWKTSFAELKSDNFYIKVNGKKFFGKDPIIVHSNPGIDYTTLEATWNENGVEMRLYMYFRKTANNTWEMYELRSYNGLVNGDWVYYKDSTNDNISELVGQSSYSVERKFIPINNQNDIEIYCKGCSINAFIPQDIPLSNLGFSLQAMIGLQKNEIITLSTEQNTGGGVNVILRDSQGNIVIDQSNYYYEWKTDGPKVINIVPSSSDAEEGKCLYGVKPPCPNNHAYITGVKAGNSTVIVNAISNSTGKVIAHTSFPVIVKEFGSTTPINSDDLTRLQEKVDSLSEEVSNQRGALYRIQDSVNKISEFLKKFFKSIFK